jgi:hypothetical protein
MLPWLRLVKVSCAYALSSSTRIPDLWIAKAWAHQIGEALQVCKENNVCKVWNQSGHNCGHGHQLGLSGLGLSEKKKTQSPFPKRLCFSWT